MNRLKNSLNQFKKIDKPYWMKKQFLKKKNKFQKKRDKFFKMNKKSCIMKLRNFSKSLKTQMTSKKIKKCRQMNFRKLMMNNMSNKLSWKSKSRSCHRRNKIMLIKLRA